MIAKFEAKKAKLKAKNSELLKHVIEETTKYKAENDELKARIEELEKGRTDTVVKNIRHDVKNAKLKTRVAKLEKKFRQSQNDLSSKEPVIIIEFVISGIVSEVQLTIDDLVLANSKISEDIKTDAFLDKVNKKNVSDNIR